MRVSVAQLFSCEEEKTLRRQELLRQARGRLDETWSTWRQRPIKPGTNPADTLNCLQLTVSNAEYTSWRQQFEQLACSCGACPDWMQPLHTPK
jgi:hypothetical protein